MRVCTQLHMNIEQRSLRFCLVDSAKGNSGNDFVSCLGLKKLVYLYLILSFYIDGLKYSEQMYWCDLTLETNLLYGLICAYYRLGYKEIHYTQYLNQNIPNISIAFFIMVKKKKKKSRSFQKSFRKKNSIK